MRIKMKIKGVKTDLNSILPYLKKEVTVTKVDSEKVIEFEFKSVIETFHIGMLNFMDSGEVRIENNIAFIKCYSLSFWILPAFIFIISGIITGLHLIGLAITMILCLLIYLGLRVNIYLLFKIIIGKAVVRQSDQ